MDKEMLNNPAVTLEEIVFENRNKDYGAYVLRKKFRKFLTYAFCIAVTTIFLLFFIPFMQAMKNKKNAKVVMENVIAKMETLEKQESLAPPPPPPPPPPAAAEQSVKYVAPVVVDTVKEVVEIATVDDAKDASVNEPVVPDRVEIVQVEEKAIEEKEEVFIIVEEPATFQGGDLNSFRDWVQKNLKYPPVAAENGISGKVYVQFAINSKGEVMNVQVLRGVDPSLDKESIRVIQSSPLWTPAKQGGRNVAQQFVIPLSFVLQ